MFPYHDENDTQRTPIITMVVIALCVMAWLLVQGAGSMVPLASSVCNFGLIPGELLGTVPVGTGFPIGQDLLCVTDPGAQVSNVVTHMFLHGSWMHLLGNMWFLWLFGNNVEDSMGHVRYLVFYLLSGLAAAAAQTFVNPNSAIPMVGASGAISGVMGAYIVLYPRVKVHMLVVLGFFITRVAVPAFLMLGYWLLLQILGGLPTLGDESGGVAFWAHAGGFVAGALLVFVFKDNDLVAKHRAMAGTMSHGLMARER